MAIEAVRVIVRCRPLNNREKALECKEIISIDSKRGQCSISNYSRAKDQTKTFFFDGAYDSLSTTEEIYADVVYPLVEGVTEGYNGTVFAYGQTGCGKSFTMQGVSTDPVNKGVIPRSFEHIFETTAAMSNVKYLIHASFLEIYNEEIRDLLGKDQKAKCDLKEHPERGVFVAGLSMHKVKCVEDCKLIMDQGGKNRHVGATLMNADSSRSHSIFTIYLEMTVADEGTNTDHIRAGKLNLVDLAGSERQSKTNATGDRLKEATKINLSLSALGNVISALVDSSSKHIPYRDSKLTRLLQDSLGGNTKTLMVACLSPADNNYDETLSTLRYANRAKNIKNKPTINEDPKDALLRQYQEEIARLKALLEEKMPVNQISAPSSKPEALRLSVLDMEAFAKEKEQIKEAYERRLREKEAMYAAEAANSAKLQEEISKLTKLYDTKLRKLEDKYRTRSTSTDESTGSARNIQSSYSPTALPSNLRASNSENLPILRSLDKLSPLPRWTSEKESGASPSPIALHSLEGGSSSRTYRLLDDSAPQHHVDDGTGSKALSPVRPQFAVHLATTSLVGVTTPLDGISGEYDRLTKEELLRRLHLLEGDIVGGEEANNLEVQERRSRRRRHAEEQKRLLAEANASLEDDGIMVGIYESIQDELRHKNKLLQREKQKTNSLEAEIEDLQREFELDREDYLESIRKQNRQISLLQAILHKIQPCIRRDSNYANLDKIKKQACFDDDTNEWILPALTIERTILPVPMSSGAEDFSQSGGRIGANLVSAAPRPPIPLNTPNGTRDSAAENEEARLYAKLASRSQNNTGYFASKRKEQLLMDAERISAFRHHNPSSRTDGELHKKGSMPKF
uniref:Kinesin-like protein n=1 Tax=Mesocestoides corti TaxID=53468 RepID=A0A5K3FTZ0_MESCO